MNNVSRLFFAIILMVLLVGVVAQAAQTVWQGKNGTNGQNWTNANSWSNGVPGTADTAIFQATNHACFVNSSVAVGRIVIENPWVWTLTIDAGVILTVNGDFVQQGATVTFASPSSRLDVKGNLSIEGGVFTTTDGQIMFSGTSAQTFSSVISLGTLNHVIVDNGAGVVFPVATVTTLDLTNGEVSVPGTLTVTGSVSRVDGYVAGTIEHNFTGNGSFLFAVGNTGAAPVTINVLSGTGNILVNSTAGAPNYTTSNNDVLQRIWTITVASGITADLTFGYPAGDVPGTATEPSWMAGNYNGAIWAATALDSINTTDHLAYLSNVSDFTNAEWTLGGDAALPIQTVGLSGSVVSIGTVSLAWATATETNNVGFYVERRSEGSTSYATVSSLIAGAGTSIDAHQYSYQDKQLAAGTYYYRLRQMDADGSTSYSSEVKVVVSSALGVRDGSQGQPFTFQLKQNYPNPFNPATEIAFQLPGEGGVVTMRIFNALGQEVATVLGGVKLAGGDHQASFNAAGLSSGVYYYRLDVQGEKTSFSSVKSMMLVK